MLGLIQKAGRRLFRLVEAPLDVVFTPRLNPFYHLGSLSFFLFWIVAVSGLYLYIFFDTSVFGAYASVERLTHEQWYLGGVMRSLHRYASDAMVITVILHLSREFFQDRYRGFRWFSWITGIPLLWFMFSSGINGYWLVWDRLAQYVAVHTAEWMDWLPVFGESMARNFLNQATLSDRFFSLLVFLHIGIPLMMLLGMWIHIQRVSRAKVNPPRPLLIGTSVMLVALSLVQPALSQGEANLDTVVASIRLDWYYLAIYPLMDIMDHSGVWWLLGGITLLLSLLPWLPRMRPAPVAQVHLDNCNGCGRCYEDCPYSAISMVPRSDGLPYAQQAAVNGSLCASCGICMGACPTATPFRRASGLVAGVDMPQLSAAALREQVVDATRSLAGGGRVVAFTCERGGDSADLRGHGSAVVALPCLAMLPPSFMDFVIARDIADGVFLAGCREGDCHYRLGQDWTRQRIAGTRDPALRKRVPRGRIAVSWRGGTDDMVEDLAAFRARLAAMEPATGQGRG